MYPDNDGLFKFLFIITPGFLFFKVSIEKTAAVWITVTPKVPKWINPLFI